MLDMQIRAPEAPRVNQYACVLPKEKGGFMIKDQFYCWEEEIIFMFKLYELTFVSKLNRYGNYYFGISPKEIILQKRCFNEKFVMLIRAQNNYSWLILITVLC
jgi:hypothetical protein